MPLESSAVAEGAPSLPDLAVVVAAGPVAGVPMDGAGSPAPEVDPEGCSPCTATRRAAGRHPRQPGLVARPAPRVRPPGRRPAPARWGPTRWLGPGPRPARRGDACSGVGSRSSARGGLGRVGSLGQVGRRREAAACAGWAPGQVRRSGPGCEAGVDRGLGGLRVSRGGQAGQRIRNRWVRRRCRAGSVGPEPTAQGPVDPEPVDAIGPGSVSPDPAEAAPADPDPAEPREPERRPGVRGGRWWWCGG